MFKICYLNKLTRLIYLFKNNIFYFLIIFILSGCINEENHEGIVANVNGEIITLREIESILNSKVTPILMFHNSSLSTTKNYYGDALGTLIIYKLINQDMKKRGINLSNDILENEISVIKNDFNSEILKSNFDEALIDEFDWKELTRYHIELLIFVERVLLPKIKISSEEVTTYFNIHQKEFIIPECQEIIYLSSYQKNILEQYCKHENTKAIAELQNKDIFSQTFYISTKELKNSKNDYNKGVKPGRCGKLSLENGLWKTTIISNKIASHQLELVEVYSLIEDILTKQKLNSEFEKWLQSALDNSKIMVSPNLKNALLSFDVSQNIPNQDKNFNELENSI